MTNINEMKYSIEEVINLINKKKEELETIDNKLKTLTSEIRGLSEYHKNICNHISYYYISNYDGHSTYGYYKCKSCGQRREKYDIPPTNDIEYIYYD